MRMRTLGIGSGIGLLLVLVWLMARPNQPDEDAAPVDGVAAEARPAPAPAPAPERHATDVDDHPPFAFSNPPRAADKRTTPEHDREPPASAEPTSDESDESGEPVELAPFQLRALEQTKYDLATLLEGDLGMGVDMCLTTELEDPPALRGEIELHVELKPHRGEAAIESLSYGERSEVDDPRLLGCLHEMIAGEIMPAELLDEAEDGALTLRLGRFERRDRAAEEP